MIPTEPVVGLVPVREKPRWRIRYKYVKHIDRAVFIIERRGWLFWQQVDYEYDQHVAERNLRRRVEAEVRTRLERQTDKIVAEVDDDGNWLPK